MAGIEKIKIPILPSELTVDAILPYLADILLKFNDNKRKVQDFWKMFQNQHTILGKTRRYEEDSDINNIVNTPYLYEMVRFKSGYAFGVPKEYSQSTDSQSNSLKYLNRYSRDAKEREIDKTVATYNYATGTSYYFIEPKPKNMKFDSEHESPYLIYSKMPDTCAKIYSSYNGEPELFDMLVTSVERIEEVGKKKDITILSLYLPDVYVEFEYEGSADYPYKFKELPEKRKAREVYKMLPLVEKYSDESRIGIVELCASLQDAIDKLNSCQVDNVEELTNILFVFKNVILGKNDEEKSEAFKLFKKYGVLEIFDKDAEKKADVQTITQKLDYNGIVQIVNALKRDMFDSCGVPIPSSEQSSGGSNTGAVEKGNGYDNAYNRILDDYNSFEKADREVLKRKIFICKSFANSKINDLFAGDIDIKYNPNMSDNMLTKSQSYTNFVENGVPPVLAIQWCRISNDAITPAKQIEDYAKQLKAEAETQLVETNIGNDSQE